MSGLRRSERGSGTVWMLAFMAVVWVVAVAVMTVGGVRAGRHRAAVAADLAALAAAGRFAQGPVVACRAAAESAMGSGGRLSGCVLRGAVAEVTVTVSLRGLAYIGSALRVTAHARAGPVSPAKASSPATADRPCLRGAGVEYGDQDQGVRATIHARTRPVNAAC
ncbi:Rv3654c family TadE-like protein [Actinomadura craniellae]|nr:Rv3654c family TadE-like protein [Actinomadura craniellae]